MYLLTAFLPSWPRSLSGNHFVFVELCGALTKRKIKIASGTLEKVYHYSIPCSMYA